MKTKNLTEGAVLLALYAVMLLIFLYVPMLGVVFTFVLPIPFMYYTAKHGWKHGLVFFGGAVVLSFIVGTFFALPATFVLGLTGYMFGYGINRKKERLYTYILATLTFLVNIILQYLISALLFEINYFQEFMNMVDESVAQIVATFESFGQEVPAETLEILSSFTDMVVTLFPSLLVMASAFMVLIIQLVSFPVMKKLRIPLADAKPFRELSLPKNLIWYFLILLFLSMFVPMDQGSFMYNAVFNLVYIMQTLFVFQGITFLFYYANHKRIHKAVPAIIAVFAVMNPLFNPLLRLLGIIDVGFDLRKRLTNKNS